MIRVAFLNRTGDKIGGAEKSLELLIRYLPPDIEAQAILFEDGEFAARLRELNVPVHIVKVSQRLLDVQREKISYSSLLDMPRAVCEVRGLLRSGRFDVVHTNTIKAHIVGLIAALSLRLPTVIHMRDMVPGMGRLLLCLIARGATKRIAISNAVNGWYGLGALVIPNPVELLDKRPLCDKSAERSRLGLDVTRPVVALIGRLNRWKGADSFLRIAKIVLRSRRVQFAIIGEARHRDEGLADELRSLARSLDIVDDVHFVPWQKNVLKVYESIDVICNCSCREPFGRTLIEAANAGVPAIAFNDGGATDIIQDRVTGFLVAPKAEDAFAKAILTALEPENLARMGNAARVNAKSFDALTHSSRVATALRDAFSR